MEEKKMKAKPSGSEGLTDEEKELIKQRLRSLGYL